MECHFQEQKKEKFIRELLEVNLKNGVKEDRHIDVVLSLIELVIQCFILYLAEL